ncbi:MAG: DUF655 domain-containing protein [Methanobrevibacter sp.]|nr:DUF655 domain-containing protein [Methanobrevibacter sp.]
MNENENYALVLGQIKTKDNKNTANVVGTERFTLLHIELKDGVDVNPQDKILLTKYSDEVEKINYRISYDNLSNSEKEELNRAIHRIILTDEKKYVNFFNRQSRDRMQLHFLDGISRKAGTKIVSEREKKDFESFEDINKRVSIIDDSEELIFKRVFYELTEPNNKNENQCYLFVNIKYKQSKKTKEPKLDDFEKSDKFFIEKLKKEGLLEKSGKRIR